MTPVAAATPDDRQRRITISFLNVAHGLDHYVMLIFPTVVIGLEAVYGRSYGDLILLSTAAFTAFGLFALPFGWMADHWNRRHMIAIFFFGTGLSAIAVGLSTSFVALAIALFAVGLGAAIYHPVGLPMVIDNAVNRGRTVAWNGLWGNVGVSVATGCTALIAAFLGWRAAFFLPGGLFVVLGIAFLAMVPAQAGRQQPRVTEHDVPLDMRLVVTVVVLFLTLAVSGGIVFNAMTIALPKIVDARLGLDLSLAGVGTLATAVFLCGGATQLAIGRLVDRVAPHTLMALVGFAQFGGTLWVYYASGWPLLLALAVAISAIYGQLTVNDIVLARYAPPAWRGRIYALRFCIVFTSAGPAVWGIGKLYDHGGFDLVLLVTAVTALIYALNSLAITTVVGGAERARATTLAAAE